MLEAWELLLGTTGPDPGSGRARRRPLLLEPAVAGVLLHELVGHAVEEGDAAEGTRVLPPGVDVRAEPLRATVVDDAGVPTSSVPLVVDGRVSAPPRGHAWVGAHGPRPRTRLPLLRVSAGRPGVEPPADVLRCRAVRGARYFRGLALLDLARVERPGGTHRPAAARAVVRAADLVAATLLAGGPESPGRYGLCVKDGDGLPSRVDCPALLLPAVELVPGPS
ncbi:MAG TPA: metallopeptidase TldD-related protein [Mycobacteriales bacterium]|nr:metallopeptidase TldD-related protein [Mycobacteriales bacterium]